MKQVELRGSQTRLLLSLELTSRGHSRRSTHRPHMSDSRTPKGTIATPLHCRRSRSFQTRGEHHPRQRQGVSLGQWFRQQVHPRRRDQRLKPRKRTGNKSLNPLLTLYSKGELGRAGPAGSNLN